MPRVNVHEFLEFLTRSQTEVVGLYTEIAEVQAALEDARETTRRERRDAVEACRKRLAAADSLDPSFGASYRAAREEMVLSLTAEAQALEETIAKGEAETAALQARARELRDRLRTANPKLDAQEEQLKQDRVSLLAQIDTLDERITQGSKWFGTILRRGELRKLGRELAELDKRLDATEKALTSVRTRWSEQSTNTSEEDKDLAAKWSAIELRTARLRQDWAFLTDEREPEAERRALLGIIAGPATPPATGDAEADALFAQVDALDVRLEEQEAALATGAEMLGMLKGLGEGLDGFRKSVESLEAEQQAHSELPRLEIDVPDSAWAFHEVWPELSRYVVNEKQMAAYPGHFVTALRRLLDERLTAAGIEAMFTSMGSALSAAADRWKA